MPHVHHMFWEGEAGTQLPMAMYTKKRTVINMLQTPMKFAHYASSLLLFG